MTLFTEAWNRQEQMRHHTLLRQLKAELAAHRQVTQTPLPATAVLPSPAFSDATPSKPANPRPKLKSVEHRDPLSAVALQ